MISASTQSLDSKSMIEEVTAAAKKMVTDIVAHADSNKVERISKHTEHAPTEDSLEQENDTSSEERNVSGNIKVIKRTTRRLRGNYVSNTMMAGPTITRMDYAPILKRFPIYPNSSVERLHLKTYVA